MNLLEMSQKPVFKATVKYNNGFYRLPNAIYLMLTGGLANLQHQFSSPVVILPILIIFLLLLTGCPWPKFDPQFQIIDFQGEKLLEINSERVQPYVPIITQSEDLDENPDHPEFIVLGADGMEVFRIDAYDREIHLKGDLIHVPELMASEDSEFLIVDQFDTLQAIIDADGNLKYRSRIGMVMERTAPEIYNPCGTIDITLTLHYYGDETITALGIKEALPVSWRFVEFISGNRMPSLVPSVGDDKLEFAWTYPIQPDKFPLILSYRVYVPGISQGYKKIIGKAIYLTVGPEYQSPLINSFLQEGFAIDGECDDIEGEIMRFFGDDSFEISLLEGGRVSGNCAISGCNGDCHSADISSDLFIDLEELLRAIHLYNFSEFHCDGGTVDGYASGPGDQNCTPHDLDYNPQNWKIDLSELLRIIQFYNSIGYFPCIYHEEGEGEVEICEDGFSPNRLTIVFRENKEPLYVSTTYSGPLKWYDRMDVYDHYSNVPIDPNCLEIIDAYSNIVRNIPGTYFQTIIFGFPKQNCSHQELDTNCIRLKKTSTIIVEEPISFPSAKLEELIRNLANIPDGYPIHPYQVVNIKKLIALDMQIDNMSGIEHCAGLEEIRLEGNKIDNLNWLVDAENNPHFPNLKILSIPSTGRIYLLGDNKISDLTPLENYVNLEYLDLRGNTSRGITKNFINYDPMSCEELELCNRFNGNNIYNILPLANLTNLKYLNLSGNRICNISALAQLNNLITLHLSNNYLGLNPSSLASANWSQKFQLRRLKLDTNDLEDVTALSYLPEAIRHLDLHANKISDVSVIAPTSHNFPNLIELNLFDNFLTHINNTVIPQMESLRFLYLGQNNIHSLDVLLDQNGPLPSNIERINFLDNSNEDIAPNILEELNNQLNELRSYDILILTRDDYLPNIELNNKNLNNYFYNFTIKYLTEGDLEIVTIREMQGDDPIILNLLGEQGYLEISNVNGMTVTIPINAPIEFSPHIETVNEVIFDIDIPIFGEIDYIKYIPLFGETKSIDFLTEPAVSNKFSVGTAIPISCRRVWPPSDVEASFLYTIVCIGDGFAEYDIITGESLGQFDLEGEGDIININFEGSNEIILPWAKSINDIFSALLQTEPFREYQNYISIYRIDVLSDDNGISSMEDCDYYPAQKQSFKDTPFNFRYYNAELRKQVQLDKYSNDIIKVLFGNKTNCLVLMPNGYLNAFAQEQDFSVQEKGTAITSNVVLRRYKALHEIGHVVGMLGDEYINPYQPLNNKRYPNTVISFDNNIAYVPPLYYEQNPCDNHIEWWHWIQGPKELCSAYQIFPTNNCQNDSEEELVIYCPEGEGEGLCNYSYCIEHVNQPCFTPLPTSFESGSHLGIYERPVGLYRGGYYREYGFRPQPLCIMGFWGSEYCRPCKEQIILSINKRVFNNIIFSSNVYLEGNILTCRAVTRKPLTHSLTVKWEFDPPVQSNCAECVLEGEEEGELILSPGIEEHICCFDTNNWEPGLYTVNLVVTDEAIVNDERWVLPESTFARRCVDGEMHAISGYSFSKDMNNSINSFPVIIEER